MTVRAVRQAASPRGRATAFGDTPSVERMGCSRSRVRAVPWRIAFPLVDTLPLGSDPDSQPVSDPTPHDARCRCGESLPADEPSRQCVESAAALEHTDRVAFRAGLLMSRLLAVRTLGTLTGDLRPLTSFAGHAESHEAPPPRHT